MWSVNGEGGGVAVKGTSCDEKREGAGRSSSMQLKPYLELVGKDDSSSKISEKEKEMTEVGSMEGDVSIMAQVFLASRGAMNIQSG